MSDWTTAEFADGPKFAAWLRTKDLPEGTKKTGEVASLYRRLSAWEAGERVKLASADRWLTYLGLHLSETPDDLWLEDKGWRLKLGSGYRAEAA